MINNPFQKDRLEKWGTCKDCQGFLTEGEWKYSKWHDQCYPCKISEKQDREVKIQREMLEHHNSYQGKNRCSLSCVVCINEKRL